MRATQLVRDTGTPTDRALAAFDAFLQQWIPPALQEHVFGHQANAAEVVRRAIRGIVDQRALVLEPGPFGYAAFGQHYDPDAPDGLGYTLESAILPTLVQAQNAHEFLRGSRPGYFVVGAIKAARHTDTK